MATRLVRTRWIRVYVWRPEFGPQWKTWLFTDGPSPSRPNTYYPACWLCGRDYHKKLVGRIETPWFVIEVNLGYAHGR